MSVASLIVSIVSAVVAIASTINAWISKKSADEANTRAERSAVAAEKSAQAAESHAEISADLYEAGKVCIQLARNQSNKPPRQAALETSGYIVNTGTHDAYDVRWDAPEMRVESLVDSMPVLPPGLRVPIFPIEQYGQPDNRINVYYRREPNGEVETLTFFY